MYCLRVSYLEIYNEQVRDLLGDLKEFNEAQEREDEDINLKDYVRVLIDNLDTKLKNERG